MSFPVFNETFLRQLEILRLVLKRKAGGAFHGTRIFSDTGGAIEFSGHRPYTPGDDPRGLDHAVWARLGKLVMKQFAREEGARVSVWVDASASMNFGQPTKFDTARQLAIALAFIALAGEDEASVATFAADGVKIKGPVVGTDTIHGLMNFLAPHTPAGGTSFTQLAKTFAEAGRTPGPLMVLSDFFDTTCDPVEVLGRLSQRGFEVTAIYILSPEELSPPAEGPVELADSETGQTLSLTIGPAEQREYKEHIEGHRAQLEAACHKQRIRFLSVSSDQSLDDLLFNVMRGSHVLR